LFPSEQASLQLAKVSDNVKKLYLYDDGVNCPKNVTICKTKMYVVAGDELIINKVSGEWTCAWYNGKKRETVGWVTNDSLQYFPVSKPPAISEWVGKWQRYQDGNEIIIGSKGNKLSAEGKAVWLGIKLDDGNRVVHTGDLDGEMTLSRANHHDATSHTGLCTDFIHQDRDYTAVSDTLPSLKNQAHQDLRLSTAALVIYCKLSLKSDWVIRLYF
jgi:hypothetical protein